ncbi:hypothetical protein [Pseudofulvibacter geojedonensis]|uniref:FUSC family protein n=1 Tax=Pseudofulvibacter geojedonensis TaxID=1123758 RepID=A0ABW3HZ01_9FLAO
MRLLALIIAIIGLIITIAFTIFPVGSLTIFPAIITLVCGFILYRLNKHDERSTLFPKIIIGLALVSALISISKNVLIDDTIDNDIEMEQREKKSKQDAVKDLEELE